MLPDTTNGAQVTNYERMKPSSMNCTPRVTLALFNLLMMQCLQKVEPSTTQNLTLLPLTTPTTGGTGNSTTRAVNSDDDLFNDSSLIGDILKSHLAYRVSVLINNYKYCVIIFIAIPANVFTILTMKSRMLLTPSCFFVGVMAVFDSAYILSMTVYIAFPVVFNTTVRTSDSGCKAIGFISNFCAFVAAGLIVCVTVERCIAIVAPFKAKQWCTLRRSVVILTGLCLESAAFNVFWTFRSYSFFDPIFESYECTLNGTSVGVFERWSSSLHRCFIPVILLTVLNIVAITKLQLLARSRKGSNSLNKKKNDITVMLLSVSVAFTVLTAPFGAYLINNFLNKDVIQADYTMSEQAKDSLFASIVFLFIDINHSINFFLFCLSSKRFRKDFVNLWKRCCKTRNTFGLSGNGKAYTQAKQSSSSPDTYLGSSTSEHRRSLNIMGNRELETTETAIFTVDDHNGNGIQSDNIEMLPTNGIM